ncbi:MAG: hypothetical protein L0154_09245 [Chloroflexi bacterium]|nr:hypothetical protein [Chloroflexota bacterium]
MSKLVILIGMVLMVLVSSLNMVRAANSTIWWASFVSNRDGTHRLYKMRPDGMQIKQLSEPVLYGKGDYHSPDGEWLVFDSYRDGNWEVFRRRSDGSSMYNVTQNPAVDSKAVWTPDGHWIIVESDRDGNRELYRMRPDGSRVMNLTNNPAFDCCVAFSPVVDVAWHPGPLLVLALLAILTGRFWKLTGHEFKRS